MDFFYLKKSARRVGQFEVLTYAYRTSLKKVCKTINFTEALQYCLWILKKMKLRNAFVSKSDFSTSQLKNTLNWRKIKLATGNWS